MNDKVQAWWNALEEQHEAMSAEERERWYETYEGGVYLELLQDSWRGEWDVRVGAAYDMCMSHEKSLARAEEIKAIGVSYDQLAYEKATLEELIGVLEDTVGIMDSTLAREEAFRCKETRRKEKWTRRTMRYQVIAYTAAGVAAVSWITAIAIIERLYFG